MNLAKLNLIRNSLSLSRITETVLPHSIVSHLREGRVWKSWIGKLEPNLFDDLTNAPDEVKRALFKRHVTLVEIEAHAKCNRVCAFCPNVIVDRRKNGDTTDSELLDRLFDQLGSIDYRGQIKIARYSEPLANLPYLYERIRAARSKVPNAQLAIVTNTDYLKPAVLDTLRDAGLDKVYMSIYPRVSEKWSLKLANRYSERLAVKLGTPILSRSKTPFSLRCTYDYDGLELHSACINFKDFGSDRGNLLEQYTQEDRVGPCREPFETFVVDYTGKVMPCCNLRSDFPEHQNYITGDLSNLDESIFDIYAGRLSGWRKSMVGFDKKENPCRTCTHRDLSKSLVNSISSQMQSQLTQIGRAELSGLNSSNAKISIAR
ncbi:MAG: radical SAM protein [Pyrinomonadaceae bacterium]